MDAGTYAISPRGLTSEDYAITFLDGKLTVARAALTVVADDVSRTYGDANPTLTGSITGLRNGDAITASFSTTATEASDVGGYAITGQAAGDRLGNYSVTYVAGTLTVTPAALTVTVADAWRFVGQPNRTFTGSVAGLRNGDVLTAVYGSTAVPASRAGVYDITATLSGARLADYAVTVHKGTLEVVKPATLSGVVFEDFNDDGQVDFGEQGISGVAVRLQGTDDLGRAIDLTATTDADGACQFDGLRKGSYTITESQPAGYVQGVNAVGTAGGSVSGDRFFIDLGKGVDGMNYNFGERTAAGGGVRKGQTAQIGFWNNKNGQALIRSLNGGGADGHGSHRLGDWLATTFANIFGSLRGVDNAGVASYFQGLFVLKGPKLEAQVMATSLSVYVTNPTLAGATSAAYGFLVSGEGLGTSTFGVGSAGAAFGVADGSVLTVLDLLLATDAQSAGGVLYGGNASKRSLANGVYGALNQAGSIG